MDVMYLFDTKRKVAVDEYEETVLPIVIDSKKEESIVSVIHYAIQQLDRIGKEKFGQNAELVLKQILMNDEMLAGVSKSGMWAQTTDADDVTVVGELFKIGRVHRMKTLPDSRVQLYVEANTGHKFNYALFGLIDVL